MGVRASNGFAPNAVDELVLTVRQAPAGPVITLAEGQGVVTNTEPIEFTVTFTSEPVGFEAGDVELDGSAGGGAVALAGGPLVWTVSVTGLARDGTVVPRIPFRAWADAESFLGEGATGPMVRLATQEPVIEAPDDDADRLSVTGALLLVPAGLALLLLGAGLTLAAVRRRTS